MLLSRKGERHADVGRQSLLLPCRLSHGAFLSPHYQSQPFSCKREVKVEVGGLLPASLWPCSPLLQLPFQSEPDIQCLRLQLSRGQV